MQRKHNWARCNPYFYVEVTENRGRDFRFLKTFGFDKDFCVLDYTGLEWTPGLDWTVLR